MDMVNDVPLKRSPLILFDDVDDSKFDAYKNYRELLKSQRWKKSKMDMYRPAYGFGKKKRNADMNFGIPTPFDYGSKHSGNPYGEYLYSFY